MKMTTKDFHKQFEIDRNARTPKASPKLVPPVEAPAAIADGTSYRHGSTYFFFDRPAGVVRSSDGLRRVDGEFVGASGLKVIRIDELHEKRSDAIDQAQKHYLGEIERLRDKICELEESKPKGERSLKRILMARGIKIRS